MFHSLAPRYSWLITKSRPRDEIFKFDVDHALRTPWIIGFHWYYNFMDNMLLLYIVPNVTWGMICNSLRESGA